MRVKRGVATHTKHKKVFLANKGYRMTKRRLIRVAKQAYLHAGEHSYRGRKEKKRDFRELWITRISEAVKLQGFSYSVFIKKLKDAHIELDRKVLAFLVTEKPDAFTAVVNKLRYICDIDVL